MADLFLWLQQGCQRRHESNNMDTARSRAGVAHPKTDTGGEKPFPVAFSHISEQWPNMSIVVPRLGDVIARTTTWGGKLDNMKLGARAEPPHQRLASSRSFVVNLHLAMSRRCLPGCFFSSVVQLHQFSSSPYLPRVCYPFSSLIGCPGPRSSRPPQRRQPCASCPHNRTHL